MDFDEYRKRGKEMVDYIADYLENIRDRRVFPNVKPGYMRNLLPESAPIEGENWDNIFNDVERVIMPGVTHWQSPHMHAYFPALNSFPSLLGDMLADAINCLGFTWASSPACTELETIVMNWLGKMIGLPDEFLHLNSNNKGGGVIQTTASEATLVCLLAGRTQAIKRFHEKSPGLQDAEINARLVAYCSDQAHSSVEKAALIGLVRMRYIESDDNLAMRGNLLREAIEDDIKQGLIPFWVCATLGTTGACAFDNLVEVGDVCREHMLWLHVDAAYAGSAFICPEFRIWLKGIEKADSIAFNPSKWLMVHFDCTAMWVKDSTAVHRTFNVEPLYLQHENSGLAIDYMHWQIPLSKRFRSLKLWFVLRSYGIKGLQKHIREGVRMAQKFEALVLADHRFELPAERHLGMVVFRIKGDNDLTERLLKRLNHRGNLHCVPASLKGKYVIRFTVTSTRTTSDDIVSDWAEIRQVTTEILEELDIKLTDRAKVSLKDTRDKNEAFGSSLLLANSPMSPKIVNGSFAAIFDADEFLSKAYAGFRIAHQDSPSVRRRVRGILMSGKQFSLDSRMDLFAQSCLDSGGSFKSNSGGAICEDNEDSWEAYESLGTPPITPPPMVSPLILTPSDMEKINLSAMFTKETMESEMPVVVRVQNRNTSNSLTVDYQQYAIDKTVFVHNFDKLVSSSQCCDAQTVHQCCNSNSNTLLSPLQCHTKNHHIQIIPQKQDSFTPSTITAPAVAAAATKTATVYHGKRYLDPIIPEKYCILLNNSFKAAAESTRLAFQNSVYSSRMMSEIEEVCSDDSSNLSIDFETQQKRRRSSDDQNQILFPKIRVRISDEYGQRVKTSFDSSSVDDISNNSSDLEKLSPGELWSSLEYDIATDGMIFGSDGWTIIHPIQQTNRKTVVKCCEKCGHHATNNIPSQTDTNIKDNLSNNSINYIAADTATEIYNDTVIMETPAITTSTQITTITRSDSSSSSSSSSTVSES